MVMVRYAAIRAINHAIRLSRYFDSKKEAIEFAKENELTIKTN